MREISMTEISHFMEEKLEMNEADLTLLCGDFNITKYPLTDATKEFAIKTHPDWANLFSALDAELSHKIKVLSLGGDLQVTDLWELHNNKDGK